MLNTLAQISEAGVAVWLDDLSRERLKNGSLAKLIAEDSVVGVTTNPSIFGSAISKSDLYRNDILQNKDKSIEDIITKLTTDDVREAHAGTTVPVLGAFALHGGRTLLHALTRAELQALVDLSRLSLGRQGTSLQNRVAVRVQVRMVVECLDLGGVCAAAVFAGVLHGVVATLGHALVHCEALAGISVPVLHLAALFLFALRQYNQHSQCEKSVHLILK